jgi:hypothetical protein
MTEQRVSRCLRRLRAGAWQTGGMKPPLPLSLTWEWTTVVPEDHPMAPFVNGTVIPGDEHEPLNFKRGILYRRRVLAWRGRWRLAERGTGSD